MHLVNPMASYIVSTLIVTSANQLAGALDSTKQYLIDGAIDMGAQSITVPTGGLSIAGLGFGISSLTSSENSYNMFVTEGGSYSGNLFINGVDLGATGTSSQIFELDNDGNFGAVEFRNGNYLASSTIGNLDNYRQYLQSNVAVFAITDGLTFTGAWAGGAAIIDTVCIGVGAGVSIFKAGVGLVFSGSIRSNINALSINATTTVFDWATGNIANDGAFFLDGSRFNPASNPIPNISSSDVKARFRNCSGINNTYVGAAWEVTASAATSIASANTLYKMAGTTTYSEEHWFSNSTNNACVYDSTIGIEAEVDFSLSFTGGNNDVMGVQIRQWDNSASSYVDIGPRHTATLNGGPSGVRAENISGFAFATLAQNDRIEVWIENQSDTTNITTDAAGSLIVKQRS